MCCTVHSQLLCGKVVTSLTLALTCSLLGLKASGPALENHWYTHTVSTHWFVKNVGYNLLSTHQNQPLIYIYI